MMKVRKLFLVFLILLLATLTGCGNEQYPSDVVAVVNGKTISEKDIEKELTEREITRAFLSGSESNNMTFKETIIEALYVSEKDLTIDQIRYIESVERKTTKELSRNEAFNILLRGEILYQEALKKGYEVSTDQARQILEESKKSTEELLKDDSEVVEYINKIYKQFGFQSEEDYFNRRLEKSAQAMTINKIKNKFNETIINKLPEADGLEIAINQENAWDDYGEHLLKKTKVKILNEKYTIEFYGEPWNYGTLDLKSK